MLRTVFLILVMFLVGGVSLSQAVAETDAEITQILIQQSLAQYPGNCPCPYHADRAGRRCGKRSAYTRAGGDNPLCYPEDVTQDMVNRYKAARSHRSN